MIKPNECPYQQILAEYPNDENIPLYIYSLDFHFTALLRTL